jgi:hypothetical protein
MTGAEVLCGPNSTFVVMGVAIRPSPLPWTFAFLAESRIYKSRICSPLGDASRLLSM